MTLSVVVFSSEQSTDPLGKALLKRFRLESTQDSANHIT